MLRYTPAWDDFHELSTYPKPVINSGAYVEYRLLS